MATEAKKHLRRSTHDVKPANGREHGYSRTMNSSSNHGIATDACSPTTTGLQSKPPPSGTLYVNAE